LLLAQGLYYVLRHLCTAGLLATHDGPDSVWATLTGLMVLQGLQAVGVLAAGLLTGAGQQRGIFYGALVGVWNGVLFIFVRSWLGQSMTVAALVGEPMVQAAFGAIGGLAGSLIWKPVLPLASPPVPRPAVPLRSAQRRPAFAGPIAWGRVLTGTILAVGGVVWCDVIREFVLEASEGRLRIDTHLQAELVTWEISALAMLAGSALAGATTKNGLKQGLIVGIGMGVILLGLRLGSLTVAPRTLILTLASSLCLGLVGGWFGSQLLPPICAPAGGRRRRPAPV
jgi:hypothetical protein